MDELKKKDRYEDAKKFVRYSDGVKMYSMGRRLQLLRHFSVMYLSMKESFTRSEL